MQLQAVSSKKLYIQIADQIRGLVDSGKAQSGQQLPAERELAEQLGVSRPTVREALIALEVAGLIEIRVGVGAFVRARAGASVDIPANNHSPLEIMDARLLIEPHVAGLAATTAEADAIAEMETLIAGMRLEVEQGRWSATSDQRLHMIIAENCGNQMLREILFSLWSARSEGLDLQFHQHLSSIAALRRRILADHAAVVQAIAAGDVTAANRAMKQHLTYVRKAMLNVWD